MDCFFVLVSCVLGPERRPFLLIATIVSISGYACSLDTRELLAHKSADTKHIMVLLFDGVGEIPPKRLMGQAETRLNSEKAAWNAKTWIMRLAGPQKLSEEKEDRRHHSPEAAAEVRDAGHQMLCKQIRKTLEACNPQTKAPVIRIYLGGISRGACTALSLSHKFLDDGCEWSPKEEPKPEWQAIQGVYLVDMVCFENRTINGQNPEDWKRRAPPKVRVHHVTKPLELDGLSYQQQYRGTSRYFFLTSRLLPNPAEASVSEKQLRDFPELQNAASLKAFGEEVIDIRTKDMVTEWALGNDRTKNEGKDLDHMQMYKDPFVIPLYQEVLLNAIRGE